MPPPYFVVVDGYEVFGRFVGEGVELTPSLEECLGVALGETGGGHCV